ncbi:MAG: glycosyltransferase, partial [Gemmatimonadota bacterium]
MKITWSIPVRGDRPSSGRADLVRAHRLTRALQADGHAVVVVDDAGVRARLEVAFYRIVVRPLLPRRLAAVLRDMVRARRAKRHAERVAEAARRQGAELIVETQVHPYDSGVRAARELGVPLVVDDCSPAREAAELEPGLPRLATSALARQTEGAAMVVASSPRLRAVLARDGIPAAKLRVVRNSVDTKAYARGSRATTRTRLKLEDRFVVGYVGSFKPWHQVDLLVEAIARLAPRLPVHLLLVGDGPTRRRVRRFARKCGLRKRLTVTGAVEPAAVPALLAACDAGVLPATNDYGHPMALLEYAAAGLPIIAPDQPNVRDVVDPDATGLLVPPGNVGALT